MSVPPLVPAKLVAAIRQESAAAERVRAYREDEAREAEARTRKAEGERLAQEERERAELAVPDLSVNGPRPVRAVVVAETTQITRQAVVPIHKASRNEARIFALALVRDPVYRQNLMKAMRDRTVPAAVETTILAYAYGKPTERVEVGRPGDFEDLEDLSDEALLHRSRMIVGVLEGDEQAEAEYERKQLAEQSAVEEATDVAATRVLMNEKKKNAKRNAADELEDE